METDELVKIRTERGLEINGVTKIVVEYNMPKRTWFERLFFLNRKKFKKEFEPRRWVIFRKDIIENLYNKGLCKINFELI